MYSFLKSFSVSFFLFLNFNMKCSVVKEEHLHVECTMKEQIKTVPWCQTELCQKHQRPFPELFQVYKWESLFSDDVFTSSINKTNSGLNKEQINLKTSSYQPRVFLDNRNMGKSRHHHLLISHLWGGGGVFLSGSVQVVRARPLGVSTPPSAG